MAAYQTQQINVGSIAAPDVGSVFTNFADRIQRHQSTELDRERQARQEQLDRARYENELGFRQRAEQRDIDRIAKENQKELATNEAMRAVLDPKGYQASKIAAEQGAIQQSLANLSPEERAVAEQQVKTNYTPEASGKQWLDVAQGAKGADIGKMFDAKSRQYEVAAKTPGTPEYIAAENAKMDLFKREQAIAHGNRMAEIGAQAAASRRLAELGWDKPQAFVDPKTGDVKIFKPSERDKFAEYTTTPEVYGDKLRDLREREEKTREFAIKKGETENKYKGQLAQNIANYDAESKGVILKGITSANDIIAEYNKTAAKPADKLTNADFDSLVSKSKGRSIVGRDDIDTDAFEASLAGEISAKTGKPVEEILRRLKSLPSKENNTELQLLNSAD